MLSTADTSILKELLKAEVEEFNIKRASFQTFIQKVPLSAVLGMIEKDVLQDISAKIDALSALLEKELPLSVAKLKRRIAECKKWLEYNRIAYERARPDAPPDDELYRKLLLELDDLRARIDLFLPQALAFRRQCPPPNLLENALKASEKIAPFLAKKFAKLTNDPAMNEQLLRDFLDKKRHYFKQICAYAAQHLFAFEKTSLEEGRGLFIQVPSVCPFPLIYSMQGDLYLILDIGGLVLGEGGGKFSTQCIDLMKGEVYALLKPRILSVQDEEEEEKQKTIKWNFLNGWKESEFLISLQGCKGVLQMKERFVFDRNNQWHLYLIEQLYLDGDLYTHFFAQMILQTEPRFTLAQKLRLTQCLLCGLKNIHEKHIVHGDIKANNILLSLPEAQEIAVITDFNASYLENDSEEKLNTKPIALWCAPELAAIFLQPEMSTKEIIPLLNQAPDVWAMGLILYMLFYDQFFPWWELKGDNPIYEHLVQLKEDWLPSHPEAEFVAPLLKKMLNPNVNKRCTSAEALSLFESIYQKVGRDALS